MVRDVSDHEWETWKTISSQVYLYVLLYPVFSWCVKKYLRQFSIHFCVSIIIIIITDDTDMFLCCRLFIQYS